MMKSAIRKHARTNSFNTNRFGAWSYRGAALVGRMYRAPCIGQVMALDTAASGC